jgi:hypothetical protein
MNVDVVKKSGGFRALPLLLEAIHGLLNSTPYHTALKSQYATKIRQLQHNWFSFFCVRSPRVRDFAEGVAQSL